MSFISKFARFVMVSVGFTTQCCFGDNTPSDTGPIPVTSLALQVDHAGPQQSKVFRLSGTGALAFTAPMPTSLANPGTSFQVGMTCNLAIHVELAGKKAEPRKVGKGSRVPEERFYVSIPLHEFKETVPPAAPLRQGKLEDLFVLYRRRTKGPQDDAGAVVFSSAQNIGFHLPVQTDFKGPSILLSLRKDDASEGNVLCQQLMKRGFQFVPAGKTEN